MTLYRVFPKTTPLTFYYTFVKFWTSFIKNYSLCTLENVLSSTIKNFSTYIKHCVQTII